MYIRSPLIRWGRYKKNAIVFKRVIEIPENAPLTYNDTIGPLLQSRCGLCHGGDNLVKNLDLTSYSKTMEGGTNGRVIVPNDPAASLLILMQSAPQPHFGQLNPDELEIVMKWIEAGAPED